MPIESRVVEIFKRIDEFSKEGSVKLAGALKQYWESHGKWKKGSKKQREKVRKIKVILEDAVHSGKM